MGDPTRRRSTGVTQGVERAPARSMLRAVGFTDQDFDRPQIGVASSANEVTPCNVHLDRLAAAAKEGVREAGGVPVGFTTIAVSVTIAGCDKSLPGMLMAAARLNLPSVFLYGGSILPGHLGGRDVTIQDVFE